MILMWEDKVNSLKSFLLLSNLSPSSSPKKHRNIHIHKQLKKELGNSTINIISIKLYLQKVKNTPICCIWQHFPPLLLIYNDQLNK